MTILDLIDLQARQRPEREAIIDADGAVSYGQLAQLSAEIGGFLDASGVKVGARVASTVGGSVASALAFISIASRFVYCPLNPEYRRAELESYLTDLRPEAIVVEDGLDSEVADVASQMGIKVVTLSRHGLPSAGIELATDALEWAALADAAHFVSSRPSEDDLALLLHTSGTTSKPKVVPLTHKNLCSSASHIVETLRLGVEDRCLGIMPLFHIHGLVGATLAPLFAGGSVAPIDRLEADRFLGLLSEVGPTWYTAVPTMHQAILDAAKGQVADLDSTSLRFIRSSSAKLPESVRAGLEELFQLPVIEAYGMTEAAHQIASNPLPPAARKPGSVGIATGCSVRISTEDGAAADPGMVGEISISGDSVMTGYEGMAVEPGQLATGDLGCIDEDGYITITGRKKEMINRGGENISPLEIEEALLAHDLVAEAAVFALPHPTLGEEVGAVVVFAGTDEDREDGRVGAVIEAAASRIASHKLPRRIFPVDAIPTGPSGKVQRKLLGSDFGRKRDPLQFEAAETDLERQMAEVWRKVLKVTDVGRKDDFFALGGDSLRATMVLSRVKAVMGVELDLEEFFDNARLDQMSALTLATMGEALETSFEDLLTAVEALS